MQLVSNDIDFIVVELNQNIPFEIVQASLHMWKTT